MAGNDFIGYLKWMRKQLPKDYVDIYDESISDQLRPEHRYEPTYDFVMRCPKWYSKEKMLAFFDERLARLKVVPVGKPFVTLTYWCLRVRHKELIDGREET